MKLLPRWRPPQGSLRRQLLLHLAAPLLLVLVLGAAGGMLISGQIGYMVHDQWLLDSAMSLRAQVHARDGKVSLQLPSAAVQMFEWDVSDRIFWQASTQRQGWLLGNAPIAPAPSAAAGDQPQFYDAQVGGRSVRVVQLEFAAPGGLDDRVRIAVAETMHKRDLVAYKSFWQWAPLQVAVLLLVGVSVWLAVARSLARVDSIAARLGSYRPDSRMPMFDTARLPSEIVPLIGAINGLIVSLSEEQQTQKRFISNAAHQLRTPLASLQVQSQRALRERDPVRREQAMEDVHRAVTRLHHVTQQLLTLMRSEQATEQHLKLVPVDLAQLAREEVERWMDQALRCGVDLGYSGPETALMIDGDPYLLHEMIGNLLDNAIKYSRQGGGMVTLELAAEPLALAVVDDGPGIAEHERALVLERFYRGASSELAGGCGLGLPIAREIAARHGATLEIGSGEQGRGTRVTIRWQAGVAD